ncbi:hypothetical protein, partial [Dermacoccus nishinomiyaensis]|uniref:hypothetical protein n=1 Tax=Dermacoccus nishinomiyaensis TaxID=1274 RepID=UPI001C93078E
GVVDVVGAGEVVVDVGGLVGEMEEEAGVVVVGRGLWGMGMGVGGMRFGGDGWEGVWEGRFGRGKKGGGVWVDVCVFKGKGKEEGGVELGV